MRYFQSLSATKDDLVSELYRRGIQQRYLGFGGPGEVSSKRPTIPTDARSEFLANRAMGDWAEDVLAQAIRDGKGDWTVSHYGNAQRIAAGDDGFREFYLSVMEEVRKYGKRPDLLVFAGDSDISQDITSVPFDEADRLVRKAVAAVEVRSSKFEALKYMRVRKEQREAGKGSGRSAPSFTVKVEDLKIVYRWIERYGIPQSYCQVFFDVVFCINFLDLFKIIASGEGFTIETPAKSQLKATIMVPVTCGQMVGEFMEPPAFEAMERVTRLGRHDAYVVPKGGRLVIDSKALFGVLIP
ncbi:MAG: AccI family restriction endonuclease [Planctomycetota bacterium]|nr:AccI family restriction endonuclease [Planctomycetota bacterium]